MYYTLIQQFATNDAVLLKCEIVIITSDSLAAIHFEEHSHRSTNSQL